MALEGEPRETREDAARFVFLARESAKDCSVSNAYRDPSGNWRSNGSDIRWYKRRDILPDVPAPCDIGLFSDDSKQASMF